RRDGAPPPCSALCSQLVPSAHQSVEYQEAWVRSAPIRNNILDNVQDLFPARLVERFLGEGRILGQGQGMTVTVRSQVPSNIALGIACQPVAWSCTAVDRAGVYRLIARAQDTLYGIGTLVGFVVMHTLNHKPTFPGFVIEYKRPVTRVVLGIQPDFILGDKPV